MSDNSHIDKIFKEGLGEMKFTNVGTAWQKMETELDNTREKKKRRYIIIALVAAMLLTVGYFTATNIGTSKNIAEATNTVQIAEANSTASKQVKEKEKVFVQNNRKFSDNENITEAVTEISSGNNIDAVVKSNINQPKAQTQAFHTAGNKTLLVTNAATDETATGEINNAEINQEFSLQPLFVNAELLSPVAEKQMIPVLKFVLPVAEMAKPITVKKEIAIKLNKYSVELIGGTDVLRMNRKAGYYTGVRVSKMLDKGTAFSLGLSYTNNTVKDNYRRTTKPAEQPRADFKILDMTMLRMPIYIHQQMASSKFSLMAGLVPSYVLNANIYNVPNSFNPNPEDYRQFGIKDINRFNVLFGAGIKYAPLSRVAVEISGSYGFTGLVKDSYRNQSRVLDNFKSIQAGVVIKLK